MVIEKSTHIEVNKCIGITIGQPYTPYTPQQLDALLELLYGSKCKRGGALELVRLSYGDQV
jgi:hypothetical protein